jgi:TonB-dependent heme/hemoglobin receptor
MRRLLLVLLLLPGPLGASVTGLSAAPPDQTYALRDRVVTATKSETDTFRVPQFVSTIPRQEIDRRIPATTPDLLDRQAGILVQKTNLGGGSPFIRGLTGKQILLLVDGIRLNSSLYRFGPHQYLNTIDPNIIERIEVVRGPMSVLYGSDALGGTVNVITRKPTDSRAGEGMGGLLYGKYGSAANERQGRVQMEARTDNLGSLMGATYKAFSDLRGGRDVGNQEPTGYEEADLDAKLTLLLAPLHELSIATQFTRQFDVPKTSEVTLDGKLKYNYEPQIRSLTYIQYEGKDLLGPCLEQARISISYHIQEEGEEVIRDDPNIETEEENDADTLGVVMDFRSDLGRFGSLSYGTEFYNDWISSSKIEIDRGTGLTSELRSAFPDDGTYRTLGIYVQDEIRLTDRVTLITGGRYSYIKTEGTLADPETGAQNELSLETDDFSGMAHTRVEIRPWLAGVVGVAQGFRAPNMEDFFGKVDFTDEIPNTDLEPESSINFEVGLKARHPRFTANLFYFLSEYDDLIDREQVGFQDDNEDGIQDPGEDPIFQRRNVGEARIEGVELDFRVFLPRGFSLFGTYSWIEGTNQSDDEPLRRIPPMQGTFGVRYEPTDRWWVEAWGLFAGKQDRLSPADVKDERVPSGGTPGYEVFNLSGGLRIRDGLEATLVLENLTDEKYKTHGSGIYFPGINAMFGLRYTF